MTTTRRSLEEYKEAGVALAIQCGKDPDAPTYFGHIADVKRPTWVNYAEQLRALDEKLTILDELGPQS